MLTDQFEPTDSIYMIVDELAHNVFRFFFSLYSLLFLFETEKININRMYDRKCKRVAWKAFTEMDPDMEGSNIYTQRRGVGTVNFSVH